MATQRPKRDQPSRGEPLETPQHRTSRLCDQLHPRLPEAHLWTVELLAQILVARGLDRTPRGPPASPRRPRVDQ
jgi:hypothetical protein